MSKDSLLPALPETGPTAPVISVEHLNFYYGKQQALKDISLRIYPREITAIIGPSGCGKSTLLRCFNLMNEPIANSRSEGGIYFKGTDINTIRPDEIRGTKVGMVLQTPNPFLMSIYDNVAFGPRLFGVTNKNKLDEIVMINLKRADLLDELAQKLKDPALSLSEGQQQRLCLARALVLDPEVLLLDESTAKLDQTSTHKIEDLLLELKQTMTIVIVTHGMSQAKRIGDKIVYINKDMSGPDTGPGEVRGYGDKLDIINNHGGSKEMREYLAGHFG